jgi:hypothetical protein
MTEAGEDARFRGYLVKSGALTLGAAALFAGSTLIIDPFGISPISVTIPSINTVKIARHNNDRLVKPFDAIARRPRTVIIGTSRVKQAFRPGVCIRHRV